MLESTPSPTIDPATFVSVTLSLTLEKAERICQIAREKYIGTMQRRFADTDISKRVKKHINSTNPFLLAIRDVRTVEKWAYLQVLNTFFISETEATGHLLEALAKECHPDAQAPRFPADLDYEVSEGNKTTGYQIKGGKDCMSFSAKKNLSATISKVIDAYQQENKIFEGVVACCYGKKETSNPPGHNFTYLSSKEFWSQVGGYNNFDFKLGLVLNYLCAEFHREIKEVLVPRLTTKLTEAAMPLIGNEDGTINLEKVFRMVNK